MKYVKRAIPVQAIQWDGAPLVRGIPAGILHSVRESDVYEGFEANISTREGQVTIRPGDWILGPGAEGEYWPVGNDIFTKTYQPASEAFKFGESEAEALTLALTQYIKEEILAPLDTDILAEEYNDINSLVLKFSSK